MAQRHRRNRAYPNIALLRAVNARTRVRTKSTVRDQVIRAADWGRPGFGHGPNFYGTNEGSHRHAWNQQPAKVGKCHIVPDNKTEATFLSLLFLGILIHLTRVARKLPSMNASTPNSARAPLQFAVPPTTTSTVGVGGSFDSRDASNPQTTQNTLEALHRASRAYNTRITRSRYSAATRSTAPVPDAVSSRNRKRRAPEALSTPQPAKSTTPRKRARAKVTNLKKPPPQCKLEESPSSSDSQEPLENVNCCICMCDVEPINLAGVNGCEHQFCFGCIEKWAERENTCPLCKVRFTKIDRKNKKRRKGQKNTKKVKQRDQRSDLVSGTALEGLLANFASTHTPSNLTRLFLPGFGSFDFNAPLGQTRSFRSITIARGGDSSDEDDSPLSSLFRVYTSSMPPLMPMMQQMSYASRFNTTRSYASNSHDRTAGRGAENPLTIDDSDSDDDDIVVLSHRGPL